MPKLWLALFIGYNGSPFNGMQFQLDEHVLTVEDRMVQKLYTAGFIVTNNHSQLEKQERWSRAARTDKGVHAVLNCVSCHFIIDQRFFLEDGTLNRIKLDEQFRELFEDSEITYHCFRRVTTRFESRHLVNSRHYCYLCPAVLFEKAGKQEKPAETDPKIQEKQIKQVEQIEPKHEVALLMSQEVKPETILQSESIKQENIQDELLDKINICCKQFLGTHNFHNYSKNLRAKDPQAQRYIIRFSASRVNNYILFDVIGQSFIYHQIRKMIGCILMIFANNYPPSFIANTFFRNQICMPLAPPEGLYLKQLSFAHYNRKNDVPELLVFDKEKKIEVIEGQIQDFIVGKGLGLWEDWLAQLRASIYHGIALPEEDPEEKIVNDD